MSAKQGDFLAFAAICERMDRGDHLQRAGLVEIVKIASTMNPSGKRRFKPGAIISELAR